MACLAAFVLVGAACQGDGDDTTVSDSDTIATPAPESTSPVSTEPVATAPASTVADTARPGTTAPGTAASPATTVEAAPVTDPEATVPDDVLTTPPTTRAASGQPATSTLYPEGSIDPGLTPFVEIATVDLSERLGVTAGDIDVLTAVLVTWPDASLGCPEPGQVYAQVLTDGSVIELGVDGAVHRYHSGGSQAPFPCDRPLDPVPPAQT